MNSLYRKIQIFRIISTILLLIVILTPSAFANSNHIVNIDKSIYTSSALSENKLSLNKISSVSVPIMNEKSNIYDEADLYSDDTRKTLDEIIKRIQANYQADLVFVTTNTLNDLSSQKFADDFFHYNGFGMNQNNGILFLISPSERDWAISTNGYSIDVFTDAGEEFIMETVINHLRNNDYDKAATSFANYAEDFYKKASTSSPYDKDNLPFSLKSTHFIAALVFALIASVLNCGAVLSQLKTVNSVANANNYKENSSVQILSERFITSSVIATKINQNKGGSSTHSSSGGSSGGSSGKY